MADKNIRSRMQQKHDISSNWALATNFVPLAGEIIVYSDLNKFKIGDGVNKVNDLPFVTELPSQSGQSGKFLTTDGSVISWETVDALPDQTGQSGKFLTTDGSDASWAELRPSAQFIDWGEEA